MKRKVFTEGMARLMLHFTQDQPTTLQVEEFWRELNFLPAHVFTAGIEKVIATREWPSFPRVGVIVRASVDGHWHVVSARLMAGGREPLLDDIIAGYRERHRRAQERLADGRALALAPKQTQLPAPVPMVTVSEAVENGKLKTALAQAEQKAMRLEEELEESRRRVEQLTKESRAQGEELARLEKVYREKKIFLAK
jgi:hypothetical protein